MHSQKHNCHPRHGIDVSLYLLDKLLEDIKYTHKYMTTAPWYSYTIAGGGGGGGGV
jgi:hypothetical protein